MAESIIKFCRNILRLRSHVLITCFLFLSFCPVSAASGSLLAQAHVSQTNLIKYWQTKRTNTLAHVHLCRGLSAYSHLVCVCALVSLNRERCSCRGHIPPGMSVWWVWSLHIYCLKRSHYKTSIKQSSPLPLVNTTWKTSPEGNKHSMYNIHEANSL